MTGESIFASKEFEQINEELIEEMLCDDGIESWVRQGRIPRIHSAYSGGREYCWVHIPPEDANFDGTMVMEDLGCVYYRGENDTEGEGCRIAVTTPEQGKELVERIIREATIQGLIEPPTAKKKRFLSDLFKGKN